MMIGLLLLGPPGKQAQATTSDQVSFVEMNQLPLATSVESPEIGGDQLLSVSTNVTETAVTSIVFIKPSPSIIEFDGNERYFNLLGNRYSSMMISGHIEANQIITNSGLNMLVYKKGGGTTKVLSK